MTAARCLVTGATGFVGGHLVRHLLADDRDVVALVRDPGRSRLPAGVEVVPIPGDPGELAAAVLAARPDVCLHLATMFVAVHGPDDVVPMLDANVVFGARLAEALVAAGGVPLVDTGTVWQHIGGAAYAPANLYAATKQALADILRAYTVAHGLPVARLTLADTYGPGDRRPKLVPALLRAARTGEPLPMRSGGQVVDLVHVDDVVAAFVMVADGLVRRPDLAGSFVVSSGAPLTVRQVVARAEEAAGRALPVQWGARPDRPVDALVPRAPGGPVPGWRPRIDLVAGLRPLFGPSATLPGRASHPTTPGEQP